MIVVYCWKNILYPLQILQFGGIIMKEKVVLAYSGGLDTTVIIPWLKENFDYEVICVCGNCGRRT